MDFGATQYIDQQTGREINLPFPNDLLTNTAKEHGYDIKSLTIENIKALFMIFTGKWIEGALSTEDLSSISNYFLTVTKYEEAELSAILMCASELSYYIRHTDHESGEPLHGFVSDICEYHRKFCEPK